MISYLRIQEAPITDNITEDGHVGSRQPWPVVADKDGTITVPSSRLGYVRAVGFQRDLAVKRVNLWWADAFADPQKAVGMYLVTTNTEGGMQVSLSAVDTAEMKEHTTPLPVER
jgi:hypothetical protein